jgi:cytochrome c
MKPFTSITTLCFISIVASLCSSRGSVAAEVRVLVFSKTAGFRHASIPAAISTIQSIGQENGFEVVATEDAAQFTTETLSLYRAVIFANTTGDILNDEQQFAFENYIRSGGGFVGIHSAADTEYDWPFYAGLIGAHFHSHPAIQPATLIIENTQHESTRHLPLLWMRTDEWYNFQMNPRANVTVLLRIDESTYTGGTMGIDHPLAWYRPYEGGRAWYTAGGHTTESYSEPLFRDHLKGGVLWAAGVKSNIPDETWPLYD